MKSATMTQCLTAAILLLALAPPTVPAEELAVATVLHQTASSVYLDKGAVDGLTPGVLLHVFRDGQEVGSIEVGHVSRHSASCTLPAGVPAPAAGDELRYARGAGTKEGAGLGGLGLDLEGRISLELRMFADAGDSGEDFRQPAMGLRLDGRELGGLPLDFHLRLRSRYNQRSRELDADRPETEWLHRLYEASLVHDDADRPFRLALGRLFDNDFRGAGNWDGVQAELRARGHWRLGFFAGAGLDPRDSETHFDETRLGAFAGLKLGEAGGPGYKGSLAMVRSTIDDEANRDFITMQNTLRLNRDLSLHQQMELDLNRDWREDAAGETSTLGRLNLMLRYRVSERASLGLAYDRFERVRDAATRALPDSLFPDYRQTGLRATVSLRPAPGLGIGGSVGRRDRSDESQEPLFASVYLTQADLLDMNLDLQLRYAYADGRYTKSSVPSLDIQKAFSPALRLGLGLGLQSYEGVGSEDFSLAGQWLRVYGGYQLNRSLDFSGRFQRGSGDIAEGNEIFVRLGYRF